jgi:uncharacterized protein YnzC (UPF0291/DUF896 family)
MNEKKIARINELARKSKTIGLSATEKSEQEQLRNEYRAGFRRNFENILDNCVIVDEEGNREYVRDRKHVS